MEFGNIIAAIRKFIPSLASQKKTIADRVDNDDEDNSDKLSDSEVIDNRKLQGKQITNLIMLLAIPGFLTLVMLMYFNKNLGGRESNSVEQSESKQTTIQLASDALDPDKYWRNHQEEELHKQKEKFNAEIEALKEQQEDMVAGIKNMLNKQLHQVKEQLNLANAELAEAALELKAARVFNENQTLKSNFVAPHMNVNEVSNGTEFDVPKPASNYIPEGTYFTGNLPGGIVVSTGLNAPDENATIVMIRLVSRGNLSPSNKLDVSKCRIRGSAYGDLSSERAIIRLEKLICEVDGNYVTSLITGQIYGPDGLNGLKGDVIATSEKHIRSALIGGVLSGFAKSVKGQDGMAITGLGVLQTEKKGFKDMAKEGGMEGVASAGEKMADFYLKQAERMSPVLVIPGGVRVNAQITEGFFFGEIGTHQRVKNMREK